MPAKRSSALVEKNNSTKQPECPISSKKRRSGKAFQKLSDTLFESGLELFDAGGSDDASTLPHSSNTLRKDKSLFQRSLERNFREHPEAVKTFLSDLKKLLDNNANLKICLLPTVLLLEDSEQPVPEDSLVRILLTVDCVQPELMQFLLEKLPEFGSEHEFIFSQAEKINFPRMIINQMRWLDKIVDNGFVCTKLLEVISVTTVDVQKDIISAIPEIMADSHHDTVAAKLVDLIQNTSELTVTVLDTLSDMVIKSADLLTEIRSKVIGMLPSVEIEHLPVIIRFLLQSVVAGDPAEVISAIRTEVDFGSKLPCTPESTHRPVPGPSSSSSSAQPSGCSDQGSVERLVVDAVKSCVHFYKAVANAWFKAVESGEEVKIIDLFFLLVLYALPNRKKSVEGLVKSKVKAGTLKGSVLEKAFSLHAPVLRLYFPSVLGLSETLSRSSDPTLTSIAQLLYREAFKHFDSYCRQEIVSRLVTHIGSGSETEMDSSFKVLTGLCTNQLPVLIQFGASLKGLIDHIDNLSVSHIRHVYTILTTLSYNKHATTSQANYIQDDLNMIVRKQLSNSDLKYKRMGVIGGVMVIQALCSSSLRSSRGSENIDPDDDEDSTSSHHQVSSLVQLILSSSSKWPEVTALFMDELSAAVRKGQITPEMQTRVCGEIINDFQNDFVVDIEPDLLQCCEHVRLVHRLDNEDESSIAVNILPLMLKEQVAAQTHGSAIRDKRLVSPTCLAAHFRLVRVCEKSQTGNLDEIDAILGCPVYTCDENASESFSSLPSASSGRALLCRSLLHTINWFRELLSAFSSQLSSDMPKKCVARLSQLVRLHENLNKCLIDYPTFTPPNVNLDGCLHPGAISVQKQKKPTAAAKKKKSKKRGSAGGTDGDLDRVDEDASRDGADDSREVEETAAAGDDGTKCQAANAGVALQSYIGFVRELDMDVFNLLKVSLDPTAHSVPMYNTQLPLHLTARELHFLLDDLLLKLKHLTARPNAMKMAAISSKTKSRTPASFTLLDEMNGEDVTRRLLRLAPDLTNQLDAVLLFFQNLISMNDGVLDGAAFQSPEVPLMGDCFAKILQAFTLMASPGRGFLLFDNSFLLRKLLTPIAQKVKSGLEELSPEKEILKYTFLHFESMVTAVPDLICGVELLKLLTVLQTKTQSKSMKGKIATHAEDYLKRQWLTAGGEREKGAVYNANLEFLVSCFITHSSNALSALEALAGVGASEMLESNEEESATYPTLTKPTFRVYYKTMLQHLVSFVRTLTWSPQGRHGSTSAAGEDDQSAARTLLAQWSLAVRVFHMHVSFIKVFDSKLYVYPMMKQGRVFMEVLLKLSMPLMDAHFRQFKDDILSLLKNLQMSTRSLQHMCSHAKTVKDLTLANQVPPLKKTLEMFLYQVKTLLASHRCLEAFWLGNLRNRNLQGVEILTQNSTVAEDQSDDEGQVQSSRGQSDDEGQVQSSRGQSDGEGQGSNGEDSESESVEPTETVEDDSEEEEED